MAVEPACVILRGKLPFAAIFFKDKIEGTIRDQARILLAAEEKKPPVIVRQTLRAAPKVVAVRDLRLNDRGDDVRRLQRFLIARNLGPAAQKIAQNGASGKFGPVTLAAVKELQKSLGLPQLGIVGPKTRKTIREFVRLDRDLRLNDRGEDVRRLQQFLIARNLGPAAQKIAQNGASGKFGPVTVAAVKELQKSLGLPQLGIVGPKTRKAIK
jgi:peptidoglycan hydrolase-like protein with peptidoglycan-binding domain